MCQLQVRSDFSQSTFLVRALIFERVGPRNNRGGDRDRGKDSTNDYREETRRRTETAINLIID